jgi:hypothetical protein
MVGRPQVDFRGALYHLEKRRSYSWLSRGQAEMSRYGTVEERVGRNMVPEGSWNPNTASKITASSWATVDLLVQDANGYHQYKLWCGGHCLLYPTLMQLQPPTAHIVAVEK